MRDSFVLVFLPVTGVAMGESPQESCGELDDGIVGAIGELFGAIAGGPAEASSESGSFGAPSWTGDECAAAELLLPS